MKTDNLIQTVMIAAIILCIGFNVNAQPNLPKNEIPSNLPEEISKEIEALYSADDAARGNAARKAKGDVFNYLT